MESQEKFYQKWWFWVIIACIFIILILVFVIFFKKEVTQGVGTAGISKEEFDEISLGMTQFKVDEIVDKFDEWEDDEIYNKCCEKISSSSENGKYINVYKYYGEKSGYALITFEVDYSEGYYGLKYPEVVKKEKFDLR